MGSSLAGQERTLKQRQRSILQTHGSWHDLRKIAGILEFAVHSGRETGSPSRRTTVIVRLHRQ